MKRIDISKGDGTVVVVGRMSLKVVTDRDGNLGIADSRGAWLPPCDDNSLGTFPVQEESGTLSDHGEQVDAMIAEMDSSIESGGLGSYSMTKLIKILYWLVRIHPIAPALLVIKAYKPTISCRDAGKTIGLGRSQTSEVMRILEKSCPRFFTLLTGCKANANKGQRQRRKRDKLRYLVPPNGSFE